MSRNEIGVTAAEAGLAGTLSTGFAFEPFGRQTEGSPFATATTSERYSGTFDEATDPAAMLVQMGARDVDPLTGRFLSVDPVLGGSCNSYDFACQDPVNNSDLDGTVVAMLDVGGDSTTCKTLGAVCYTPGSVPKGTGPAGPGHGTWRPYAGPCLESGAFGAFVGGFVGALTGCASGATVEVMKRSPSRWIRLAGLYADQALNVKDAYSVLKKTRIFDDVRLPRSVNGQRYNPYGWTRPVPRR